MLKTGCHHLQEDIKKKIYHIRGKKVMLDRDLARLYGVPTYDLKQTVNRNLERFPCDFMFVVTASDCAECTVQPHFPYEPVDLRPAPMAFTAQGVVMLSNVINTERSVEVNLLMIRSLGNLRHMFHANGNSDREKQLKILGCKHDSRFRDVFSALHALLEEPGLTRQNHQFTPREKQLEHEVWLMG